MSNFSFSGFSDLGNTEINAGGGFQKDVNKLECKPENGMNGMYEFFGRFLPNPYDVSKSMIAKSVVRIKNPAVSGESVTFDCPKSVFKPSFFFTLDKILKKYENEAGFSEIVKQLRKSFSRWYSITSLMYIYEDGCHPENNNKIKIFQYGSEINKKIDEVQKGTGMFAGCKPFDLLAGKDFHYLATVKSKALGYSDYSSCAFVQQASPFKYFINGQFYNVTHEELNAMASGQNTLLAQLYEQQCPDMTRYEYQAPTSEQLAKAANYIRIIFASYPTLLQEAMQSTDDVEFVALIQQQGGVMVNAAPQVQQPMMGQQMVYGQQPNAYTQGGFQPQQSIQQPVYQQQPQQFVQAPQINTFQQPQPVQAPSDGGFMPQPQQAPVQPDSEPIQTFGGGDSRFQEAMDSIK